VYNVILPKRLAVGALALILIVVMASTLAIPAPAEAQKGATPTPASVKGGPASTQAPVEEPISIPPSPVGNGGNATWTVQGTTFQSNYPNGFDFSIDVASSGGRITEAQILWRYSPKTRTRRAAEIDESGMRATYSFQPGLSDAVPQWVGVQYWWLLQDEAGNTYETDPQYAEYSDSLRSWERLESEDIIVFVESGVPSDMGQSVLDGMAEMRESFQTHWPRPLGYKPRAIIYNGFSTWGEWNRGAGTTAGSTGTVVIGQTSDTWGATVQAYDPLYVDVEETAYAIVPHEIAHLYQYANGGAVGDFWFVEGNATFFEVVGRDFMIERVRDLATNGQLPSLQGGGPSARGAFARDAYDIGFTFFVWLDEVFGPDAHRRLWDLIGQGRTTKQAMEEVTGMSFVDMETAFRTWLGATNAVAPTPFPSPTLFFPPTPTFAPTPTPRG
jgi:hypothetical protein